MDGFTGYKTAAVEAIDTVVTVMDPFHVVALVGDKLDRCRQHIHRRRWAIGVAPVIRSMASDASPGPGLGCSPRSISSGSGRCSPTSSMSRSRSPGASTRA